MATFVGNLSSSGLAKEENEVLTRLFGGRVKIGPCLLRSDRLKPPKEILHMSATTSKPIDIEREKSTSFGWLFFLDLVGGRVLSANPDGSDLKTTISEGRKLPDGLVVDVAAGNPLSPAATLLTALELTQLGLFTIAAIGIGLAIRTLLLEYGNDLR